MRISGFPSANWLDGQSQKKVHINLNDSDAIRKLFQSIDSIDPQKTAEQIMENICARGAEIAREECPVDEGELRDSITHSVESSKGRVVGTITAGSDHAMFVEFGTGVVGRQNHDVDAEQVGWIYDINNYGERGWNYEKNGKWYHTTGNVANPFMLRTAQRLENGDWK